MLANICYLFGDLFLSYIFFNSCGVLVLFCLFCGFMSFLLFCGCFLVCVVFFVSFCFLSVCVFCFVLILSHVKKGLCVTWEVLTGIKSLYLFLSCHYFSF